MRDIEVRYFPGIELSFSSGTRELSFLSGLVYNFLNLMIIRINGKMYRKVIF